MVVRPVNEGSHWGGRSKITANQFAIGRSFKIESLKKILDCMKKKLMVFVPFAVGGGITRSTIGGQNMRITATKNWCADG